MNMLPDFKKILRDNKKISNILIVILVGILLIILGDTITGGEKKEEEISSENMKVISDYEDKKKEDLRSILENTRGVGKVEVMISFETGEEVVPALNITDSTSSSEEKDNEGGIRKTTQISNGKSVVMKDEGGDKEPLIIKTYKPKVVGVYIVAEGAGDKLIELQLKSIVSKLFSVSVDKVSVMEMKK